MDFEKIRDVLAAFERERVVYAIFGAVALNLHGLARATQDLAIFVSPTEDNISRLRIALRNVFGDPHIDEITAEDLLGDYPAVQYVPPEGTFFLDILTRLGEAFRFEDLETERLRLRRHRGHGRDTPDAPPDEALDRSTAGPRRRLPSG